MTAPSPPVPGEPDVVLIGLLEEAMETFLYDRELDILKRRIGLRGQKTETLTAIAADHGISSNRVRQIEVNGISRLCKSCTEYRKSNHPAVVHLDGAVRSLRKQDRGRYLRSAFGENAKPKYVFELASRLVSGIPEETLRDWMDLPPRKLHPRWKKRPGE